MGVTYLTHQVATLMFMTNQKNIFCEELKAQLLDESLFPGYLSLWYYVQWLGDLEEGNIDSVCYAARERVYYDYPWPLNNMGLKRVGPL